MGDKNKSRSKSMKKATKLMSLLLAVLMIAVLPASVLAATPIDADVSLKLMSTTAQVQMMFPEADIQSPVDVLGCKAADVNSVPVASYKKEVDGAVHNLEVYDDGSYIAYGSVPVSGTRSYSTYTRNAYFSLGNNAYMSYDYTYRQDNTSDVIVIVSVSNDSHSAGNPGFATWSFSQARKVNSSKATKSANMYDLDGDAPIYQMTAYLNVITTNNGTEITVQKLN
jgi:hypothetical protein